MPPWERRALKYIAIAVLIGVVIIVIAEVIGASDCWRSYHWPAWGDQWWCDGDV